MPHPFSDKALNKGTRNFKAQFDALPNDVKRQAVEKYRLFLSSPQNVDFRRLLQFNSGIYYRAKISQGRAGYRAVARLDGGTLIWFFIGPHDAYDKLLKILR